MGDLPRYFLGGGRNQPDLVAGLEVFGDDVQGAGEQAFFDEAVIEFLADQHQV